VTDLVDVDDAAGPPPSDGLTLVGETKTFLKAWQRIMLGPEEWAPEEVTALRQQSRDLEARARAADVGGLAHHLASCEHCFWNGEIDKVKLAHCLRNVSEVAWQWRQDLKTRSELVSMDGLGQVPTDRLTIEPPTLLEPPSVEMFESIPPALEPEPTNDGFEQALEMWNRPSLLSRLFGSARRSDPGAPATESSRRKKRRKGAPGLPSLADAMYASNAVSPEDVSTEHVSSDRLSSDRLSSDRLSSEHVPTEPAPADGFAGASNGSISDLAGLRRGWPRWSVSLGLLSVLGVGIWVWYSGGTQGDAGPTSAGNAPLGHGTERRARDEKRVPREAPQQAPSISREAIDRLLSGAHGMGGIESPELADLIDEEAALLASSGATCVPGSAGCELVSTSHELGAAPSSAHAPNAAEARGSWLDGLELPGIGVRDEPRVREIFEFHTRNAVGRETFQELLFRCGKYRDVVRSALERYGLSDELLAVPMVASGCGQDIESADGGRGLWQLPPSAAKAYHLRVKAQVVDERIDPEKGTDTAVRLLEDLFHKTGSWELALAAYRVGPLALLARLKVAGEDASYGDLAAAGRLPDEVVKFVPKVQAFALILANLTRFRFQPVPHRPTEVTAALEVPAGTRLGLIARAAASSTTKIRELNPDVIGDRVPEWPGERFLVRVPKDAGERAREVLPELIASADHADECVPHAFDWGRQRFTTAMASRCEHPSALNTRAR
jgi:hypothetical protein